MMKRFLSRDILTSEEVQSLSGHLGESKLQLLPTDTCHTDAASTFSWRSALYVLTASLISACLGAYLSYRLIWNASLCFAAMTMPSPALEALGDKFTTIRFNGSVQAESPYKGPPIQPTRDAWESLVAKRPVPVHGAYLRRLGYNPEFAARWKIDGEDYYEAELEIRHQLHCLYMIWQNRFPDIYSESDHWNPRDAWEDHIDHCFDIIRQQLECSADIGIVPYVHVDNMTLSQPYFSTTHKCRDMKQVRAWEDSHMMSARLESTSESQYNPRIRKLPHDTWWAGLPDDFFLGYQ